MVDIGFESMQAQQQTDEDQEIMDFYRYGLSGMDHTDPAQAQAMMSRFPGMADRNKKYSKFRSDEEKEIIKNSSKEILDAIEAGERTLIFKAIDNNAIVIKATGDPGITPDVMKVVAYDNPELFKIMISGAYKAAGGEIDEG